MSVGTDVSAQFESALSRAPTADLIGLAVSGGGDSIAMMHLAAQHFNPDRLRVFTIDHGLRADAAREIALVQQQAQSLGLMHAVGQWSWNGSGNLQAAARQGRWDALCRLAHEHSVATLWFGHTEDDQIETVMMRLARGSGVDGLVGMRQAAVRDGVAVFRPLLSCDRSALRDWLDGHAIAWCDDPSNDDVRFDRVRARKLFSGFEDLGLTRKRVLQTIDHMKAAQRSLQVHAAEFASKHVRQVGSDLYFDRQTLELSHDDAARRVMAAAFGWISGQHYRPRFEAMCDAVDRAHAGQITTMGGCVLVPQNDGGLCLTREASQTRPVTVDLARAANGITWDSRWRLKGHANQNMIIRALGDAISECPQWREAGVSRRSLMASPSVWDGGTLIAAPIAELHNGWTARIVADFHSTAFAIED